jgi:hypothetical protein
VTYYNTAYEHQDFILNRNNGAPTSQFRGFAIFLLLILWNVKWRLYVAKKCSHCNLHCTLHYIKIGLTKVARNSVIHYNTPYEYQVFLLNWSNKAPTLQFCESAIFLFLIIWNLKCRPYGVLQWYNVAFMLCSVQIGHLVRELEGGILTSNRTHGGLNIIFNFKKGKGW